jgi:hypothetical protein
MRASDGANLFCNDLTSLATQSNARSALSCVRKHSILTVHPCELGPSTSETVVHASLEGQERAGNTPSLTSSLGFLGGASGLSCSAP